MGRVVVDAHWASKESVVYQRRRSWIAASVRGRAFYAGTPVRSFDLVRRSLDPNPVFLDHRIACSARERTQEKPSCIWPALCVDLQTRKSLIN